MQSVTKTFLCFYTLKYKLLLHLLERCQIHLKITSDGKTLAQYQFDATNKFGIVSKYEYDGSGRRVKMSVELPKVNIPAKGKMDAEMKKLCDDIFGDTDYKKEYNYINDVTSPYSNVLMVYGSHNDTQRYTYGLDVLSVDLFKSVDTFSTSITSGKAQRIYYLQDELGSPIKLLDESGKVKSNLAYDAFGKPLFSAYLSELKARYNIFAYTGYQYDDTTGLMYAQARYYMPEVGRFISGEAYKGAITNPQSLNWYVYCGNNPIKYVDPSGNMNYLTQCDDYRAGVKRGAGDWIGDILNTPFALFDVGKELIFGDLTVDKLLEAGLDGLVEDYEYVWDNKAAFSPFKKVCDQDVNELGYHMGKILLDVASAIVGGKLVSSLSKTKTGQKIISKVKGTSKAVTVKYGDEAVSIYRGGSDFTLKPGEIKIDKATGMVKDTHGVSLDINPDTVSKFGGAYKIDSLPDGLKIIQRGSRAEHFEIVPTKPMTVDEFQGLLNKIKTSPVE